MNILPKSIQKGIFIVPLLLFYYTALSFPPPLSTASQEIYKEIFRLRVPVAKNMLDTLSESSSRPAEIAYLRNLACITELITSESKSLYEQKQHLEDDHYEIVEESSLTEYEKAYFQSEIKIQWAFVKFNFNKKLDGLLSLLKANKLIKKSMDEHPDYLPVKKLKGIMNVLLGSVPGEYKWIMNTLGLSGNLKDGIDQLNAVEKADTYYHDEVVVYQCLIASYILKEGEEYLPVVKSLHNKNQKNLLIQFLYASMLMKEHQNEKALQLLKHHENSSEYLNFPFIDFLLGEAYLQKLNFSKAALQYVLFLKRTRGENYIKSANYRLHICYYLMGKKDLAKRYKSNILDEGNDILSSDKYALNYALKEQPPNSTLYKVRLLTDGGYYKEALTMIENRPASSFSSHKDHVELIYRKARLHHLMNDKPGAITLYTKTIEATQPDDEFYFAPNSALQLAYLYQEKKQYAHAEKYFHKAMSYKKHDYAQSINTRAEAGLQDLKQNHE